VTRSSRRPGEAAGGSPAYVDGFNPNDPGVMLLRNAASEVPASEVLLVAMGPVPGLAGARRIVLDVRELGPGALPWAGNGDVSIPSTERAPSVSLVWPRAHHGKDFAQQCLAVAALRVREGGRVLCAVRKQKGADSLAKLIEGMMGHVEVVARDRGYRLLCSVKGAGFDEAQARACLQIQYEIEDPRLHGISLRTAPGVFSRQKLDAGTQCLMDWVAEQPLEPRRVVDLCCGVGPLAMFAARRWPSCEVLAIESSIAAAVLSRFNVARVGLESRVTVLLHDGWPPLEAWPQWAGSTDLALVNPPTHASPDGLRALLLPLASWLADGGRAFVVASRAEQIVSALQGHDLEIAVHPRPGYGIVELR